MKMKKINSGRLRAIGYDACARMLQVQLDDGSTLQYSGNNRAKNLAGNDLTLLQQGIRP